MNWFEFCPVWGASPARPQGLLFVKIAIFIVVISKICYLTKRTDADRGKPHSNINR